MVFASRLDCTHRSNFYLIPVKIVFRQSREEKDNLSLDNLMDIRVWRVIHCQSLARGRRPSSNASTADSFCLMRRDLRERHRLLKGSSKNGTSGMCSGGERLWWTRGFNTFFGRQLDQMWRREIQEIS